MKTLSCAAIDHEIYVVVNHLEKQDCTGYEETCPIDGFYIYDVNLVLDRTGRVIAKYRSYIRNLKKPPKLVPTYFTTDFNVTFGLLTGRDILQKTPALNLTRDHEVKDILLSSNLPTELPFGVGIASQAAYANAYDVNLLAAGQYKPNSTNGGKSRASKKTKILE